MSSKLMSQQILKKSTGSSDAKYAKKTQNSDAKKTGKINH